MPLSHDEIVAQLMRHRATLYAYIWSIVADEHIAEDVLQDVSRLAIAKSDQINDADHVLPWARTTAKFTALNVMRKQRKGHVTLDEKTLNLLDPHWDKSDNDSSDVSAALQHCLTRLTPRARRLVQLRYNENLSGRALAEATGRQLRSVYTALSRVHRSLGDCIRERLSGDDE